MMREKPPNRRPSVNLPVCWASDTGAHYFTLSAGFSPETGALIDVFYADGQKDGSAMQHTVQDACVVISLAIQNGAALSDLAHSLGCVPVTGGWRPASVVGAIVDALRGV